MSISDKVVAAEQAEIESKDSLLALTKAYDETQDEASLLAIEEQSAIVAKNTQEVAVFREAERQLAANARVVEAPAVVKSTRGWIDSPADLLVANAVAAIESYESNMTIEACLEKRFGGDDRVKAVSSFVNKAAQPIADTMTSGWAEELVREGYSAFMDLLSPASIIPKLPLQRFDFGMYGSVKVPMRAEAPMLDGEFVAEGGAIPVKGAGLTSKTLTPKKVAVISHYTDELLTRSTPSIVQVIRDAMVRDTAIKLDTAFLSNLAASNIQPPGMETLAGAPIDGSGMITLEGTLDVLKQAVKRLTNNMLGASPAWIMHPATAMDLTVMTNAVGAPAFPTMANGSLLGIPVVTSITCDATKIFLIDCSEIAFAGGAPRFLASNIATIHEANPALPLVDGAGTAAAPVRSMYQTDSHALRAIWSVSWDELRSGGVVLIEKVPV